jgi:beta-N-acetylhexosaminidase
VALSILTGYMIGNYITGLDGSDDKGMKNESGTGMKEPTVKESDLIKKQINSMTLEEKIGQMLIVGVEGENFNGSMEKMIVNYHVGGFIFMGKSVKNAGQLLKLVNSIKAANSKNEIPLFLSIDEEGGRVDRMSQEFMRYPTNKDIGMKNSKDISYDIGSAIAYEIGSFGFNMNFAPVLDINSNPKNPVIGDRSFGTTPQVVGALGVETMKGIQAGNVISIVKHFPGHGDTAVDSHIGLPRVNKDLKQLYNFELIPFIEAIENNTDGIMIAHILLPKIDSKYPASMSKIIITDVLRKQLNFNGLVITDDMTMGAIVKNYKIGDAAVQSIIAGSDIILVAHDYNKAAEAVTAITNAVNNGSISVERINESLFRILALKQKYGLEDKPVDSVDVDSINSKIKEAISGI